VGVGIGYHCEACGFDGVAAVGWGMSGVRYVALACRGCRSIETVPVEAWDDPAESSAREPVGLWSDGDGCRRCDGEAAVLGDEQQPIDTRWACPSCGKTALVRDSGEHYLWD
jgi:predicted RNA-binding Zn-ribbon protein involved in translation (DUF1610 family)